MEQIPAFYFDPKELKQLTNKHSETFQKATPFPHVVIDNFLPEKVANLLISEFPGIDDIEWTIWGRSNIKGAIRGKQVEKIGTSNEIFFGPFTRHFMSQLNSHTFLKFLGDLTGGEQIIPDVSYNDCGLHSTGRNGSLMIHTDTNRHPVRNAFHQRYNLIFFLNKDWEEKYGGHLELWGRDKKKCVKKILPIANRAVIFDTGTSSFHGHPHPLQCPPDRRRNSLALYYYVVDREKNQHYTGYQNRVNWLETTPQDKRIRLLKNTKKLMRKLKTKTLIRKLTPPIIIDVYHRIRNKK